MLTTRRNRIWRQQDATRNSISMAARAVLSHKECHGLNCNQLQEAMFKKSGINWNSYPVACKRGVCLYRKQTVGEHDGQPVVRNPWFIDTECPVFTQDRAYVDQRFAVPEEPKS